MIVIPDRGTQWRKWDLHVHTPSSIRQGYGGDTAEVWARYLDELEALPSDFAVIGVNDYWFLDGYRRLREERECGRLANLEAIFPVLELRLEQFGGTDSHLSRANLHVIFDPELDPDVIQEQFISAMSSKFRLTPEGEAAGAWSGVVSRQSLGDFGRAIKASVPSGVVSTLGSDLQAGFNNLVVSLETVSQALDSSYFRNRTLLALGKTEWADIKWQEGAIASKKNLVNIASFLFTAFADAGAWSSQRAQLSDSKVNDRLLDCSDAHTWSDSGEKDRIGNCATWVRAEPTFSGLLHALAEFDSRVYVGAEPDDLARARTAPGRIIDEVTVSPSSSKVAPLFDYRISLNAGLVAVIGNKGQGKSALLDCIARAGNSSRGEDFAFLNTKRFLHPRTGGGSEYAVSASWCDGRVRSAPLDEAYQRGVLESVEYLPQALLERICNSDPTSEHRDSFEAELKRVIFHHIPRAEREGQGDLDSLLRLRTKSNGVSLAALREEILSLIAEFISLESRSRSLVPSDLRAQLGVMIASRSDVEAQLAEAESNLIAANLASGTENPALVADRARLAELEAQISETRVRDDADQEAGADARRRLTELDSAEAEIEILRARAESLNAQLSRVTESRQAYVTLIVDRDRLDARRRELTERADLRDAAIAGRAAELDAVRAQMAEIAGRLEVADSAREVQRRRVEQLRTRLRQLVGQDDDPETISGVEALLREAETIPSEMLRARDAALDATRRIHDLLIAQLGVIQDLYKPAARFVADEPLATEASVQFEAELTVSSGWDKFITALDGRRTGELLTHFTSRREALKTDSADEVIAFVSDVLARLAKDRGSTSGNLRTLSAAFRSSIDVGQTVGDFLALRWLEPRFGLTGNGMPLSLLSPGQRGLILLLFYLIVDRSDSPLLLDQPEENLDNDAVRRLLVPALKKARSRRQIIVVTHNANLAVVGDADQIVSCSQEDDAFVVRAGSLAGHETGEITINVLEGSREAFANRRAKYDTVVGPHLPEAE